MPTGSSLSVVHLLLGSAATVTTTVTMAMNMQLTLVPVLADVLPVSIQVCANLQLYIFSRILHAAEANVFLANDRLNKMKG